MSAQSMSGPVFMESTWHDTLNRMHHKDWEGSCGYKTTGPLGQQEECGKKAHGVKLDHEQGGVYYPVCRDHY